MLQVSGVNRDKRVATAILVRRLEGVKRFQSLALSLERLSQISEAAWSSVETVLAGTATPGDD